MDHSEHSENKHKIFKYTDKDGHVHYVDENGNPVKRRKPASAEGSRTGNHSSQRRSVSGRSGSSDRPVSSERNDRRQPQKASNSPPQKKQ